jgi:hypothetical protein
MVWQARQELNPQSSDLESAALPIMLLACMYTTIGITDPELFCLFVYSMLPAEPAILLELKFIRGCSFVFCRRIISSLAFRACKGNYYSHRPTPFAVIRLCH